MAAGDDEKHPLKLQMEGLLKAVAENPTKAGGAFWRSAHLWRAACAPGTEYHKIVITTYGYASVEAEIEYRPDRWRPFTSGGVAIALVVVVLSLLQLLPTTAAYSEQLWLEKELRVGRREAMILCWRALKKLRASYCKTKIQSLYATSRFTKNPGGWASASADAGTITER